MLQQKAKVKKRDCQHSSLHFNKKDSGNFTNRNLLLVVSVVATIHLIFKDFTQI